MTHDEIIALVKAVAIGASQQAVVDACRIERLDLDKKQADLRSELTALLQHNEREFNLALTAHGQQVRDSAEKILDTVERRFVSLDRYAPVERLLYATVTVVLMTVVGWAMSLIYQHGATVVK